MPTSVASPHPSNLIEPELPKSEQVAGVAGRGGPSVEASHRTGAQHAPTAPIRGDGRGRHTAGARITRRGHGAGGQGAAGRIPPRAADRVRARAATWVAPCPTPPLPECRVLSRVHASLSCIYTNDGRQNLRRRSPAERREGQSCAAGARNRLRTAVRAVGPPDTDFRAENCTHRDSDRSLEPA